MVGKLELEEQSGVAVLGLPFHIGIAHGLSHRDKRTHWWDGASDMPSISGSLLTVNLFVFYVALIAN